MKRYSINILCGLLLITLTVMIAVPLVRLSSLFMAGFVSGWTDAEVECPPDSFSAVDIRLEPDLATVINPTDSLAFDSGRAYPHVIGMTTLSVPESEMSPWLSAVTVAMYVCIITLFILLMIQLIRFILNINKERIFVNDNVKRLKRFGWYLLGISALTCIAGLTKELMLRGMGLQLQGYTLSAYWNFPWTYLLLGLMSLLMARVWERGIKLKEEHELTI